jgi:hypothetical protein
LTKDSRNSTPAAISRYEMRDQLGRILQSPHFSKARKKSRFLEFVCEQALLGNADKLNEYVIGVDIYERGADFNPQDDAIVRVQAHEIRKALKDYYSEDGRDDLWRIDLPAGAYVPIFTRLSETPPGAPGTKPAPILPRDAIWRNRLVLALSVACILLAGLFVRERLAARHFGFQRSGLPEAAAWFWQPFLPPAEPPLVVIPVHPLLRAAHEGDSPATAATGHVIAKEELPEFRDTIHFRELKEFRFVANTTDFTAVGETLGLLNLFELFARAGQKVQLKAGRLVDFELIKRGNAVLLGGNQSWSGRIFLYPEGFAFRAGVISNKAPRAGEQSVYRPEFDPVTNSLRRDYALVLMLPNDQRDRRILLVYGIYTQGSQAAIEYITNTERLAELRQALVSLTPDHRTVPRFFQVLLTTTVENYVPGKVSLVSARVVPE